MEDLKSSLVNVMTALMSVDNTARKAAEAYFSMQLAADWYVKFPQLTPMSRPCLCICERGDHDSNPEFLLKFTV